MRNPNKQPAALKLVLDDDQWFIEGDEWTGDNRMGPYTTKGEADDDRRGVQRFLENFNRGNYVTSRNS